MCGPQYTCRFSNVGLEETRYVPRKGQDEVIATGSPIGGIELVASRRSLVRYRARHHGRLAQLVEHLLYTQGVGGSSPSPPIAMAVEAAQVSLLRWLRRQLAQPSQIREHLEAAVEHDDPAEARRVVARLPFSDDQRRNVEQLLAAWERTLGRTGR